MQLKLFQSIFLHEEGFYCASRYSDSLQAGRSRERIPMWERFSAPVQTGPGAHPASYTMGTGSFPGVKRPRRGVDHPTTSRAEMKERVELYLYSPSGPSWHVLEWPMPSLLQSFTKTRINYSANVNLEFSFDNEFRSVSRIMPCIFQWLLLPVWLRVRLIFFWGRNRPAVHFHTMLSTQPPIRKQNHGSCNGTCSWSVTLSRGLLPLRPLYTFMIYRFVTGSFSP